MAGYTEKLADYVLTTSYPALPPEVVNKAKLLILDSVGLAIAASGIPEGKKIINLAVAQQAPRQSTILGSANKTSCLMAAWANSSLANLLDFDDTYLGHPGCTIIPTALAIGEMTKASGKELLAAVVAGYEIANRVAYTLYPSREKAEKILPAVNQVMGAAAVASKLLRLDKGQVMNAFGLACGCAPIAMPVAIFKNTSIGFFKNGFGWAAMSGVFWAAAAKEGIDGPSGVLDDQDFPLRTGSDASGLGKLVYGLGQKYTILDVSFKPYPACRLLHSSLDAMQSILKAHDVRAEQIEAINVSGIKELLHMLNRSPQHLVDAQFSLPYNLAMLALGKQPGLEWASPANYSESAVKRIVSKVTVANDPEADKAAQASKSGAMPARVEVVTHQRTFSAEVREPSGGPGNPVSVNQIMDKFYNMTRGLLTTGKAEHVVSYIENLDQMAEVTSLIKLLRKRQTRRAN